MKGFTLVELLVVIAISVLIATVTIVYGGTGRAEVALSVQSTEISGVILQAKQLAIATYGAGSTPVCGYGVDFNQPAQTYSLFIYSPANYIKTNNGLCPSLATIESSTWQWNTQDTVEYSAETWDVPVGPGVVMTTSSVAADAVLFYPPNPTTLLVQQGQNFLFETSSTAYVPLQTAAGNETSSISIEPSGQVSF